ncbi:MAG TPA: A/G-specific adenine glycosylase, partial [Saprospiraceae bacterium]|nr:A/G-specific adenine glycosylase [Saprospiraceae bacterium]
MQDDPAHFRQALLRWAEVHPRPLPWKGQSDPYRIWLSEIILQQTRVEQGLPYYERFVAAYPSVRHLADAPEEELMKLWEGLGYYSRARNLHAAARHIAYGLGGNFPTDYAGLRQLRGVGDYTAAAIASFAYGLPHAVVDGNVYRVLARCFGIATPTATPAAKRQFADLAQRLLDPARPAAFNQAIMDFGATWCKPRQPRCADCPLSSRCVALATGQVASLPLKSGKAPKKERFFL